MEEGWWGEGELQFLGHLGSLTLLPFLECLALVSLRVKSRPFPKTSHLVTAGEAPSIAHAAVIKGSRVPLLVFECSYPANSAITC